MKSTKKTLLLLLTIVLIIASVFTLSACRDKNGNDGSGETSENGSGNEGDKNESAGTGGGNTSANNCKHTSSVWVTQEPGCFSKGYKKKICESCAAVLEQETLYPNGHNYVSGVCKNCKDILSKGLLYALSQDGSCYLVSGVGICDEAEIVIPIEYQGLPVAGIQGYAFQDCKTVTKITIPEGIEGIGPHAFHNCENLTELTIPNSITKIYEGILTGCPNVKFNEYDNAYYLGNENNPYLVLAAAKNTDITSCVINENTKIIAPSPYTYGYDEANGAFRGCSKIMSITIPKNIVSIGDRAFSGCSKLVEVINKSNLNVIPGTTDNGYVGYYAKLVHSEDESKIVNYDGFLFFSHSGANYIYGYVGDKTDLVFPESYNGRDYMIFKRAFFGNKEITSVYFGSGLVKIEESAFSGCTALKSVTFAENSRLTEFENSIFSSCASLTSINVPESVTSIGTNAFSGCESLTAFDVPNGLQTLGENVFFGCNSLSYSEYDNVYYLGNEENPYLILVKVKNRSIATCKINENTKFISGAMSGGMSEHDYSFVGCYNLASVTIPESVTSIGKQAFYDCRKLLEVVNKSFITIAVGANDNGYAGYYAKMIHSEESKIKKYADYLFCNIDGTDYLVAYVGSDTNLVLPDNYNGNGYKIYDYAFFRNDNIISVSTGGATEICEKAFYACHGLKNIVFGSDLSVIGYHAFAFCSAIENLQFSDSITKIGSSSFYYCTSLCTVTFGEESKLESIERMAFNKCTALVSFTVPKNTQSIGDIAFEDCYRLAEIINKSALTLTVGSMSNGNITIYAKEVHTGESKIVRLGDFLFYTLDGVNYLIIYVGTDAHVVLPNDYNGESYKIDRYAFCNLNFITAITIPVSVNTINISAFEKCDGIAAVYYKGTEEQWESIKIYMLNTTLINAERYYYSESEPEQSGNFWHYDENGDIAVWNA